MELEDYPALYQESDLLAINAQKMYFRTLRIKIILLAVVGTITSIAWFQLPAYRTLAAIVLAVFLLLSIAQTAIMNIKDYDHIWSSGREIAESVKTETWYFMMKAEPFPGTITESKAEERFLNRLDEIRERAYSHHGQIIHCELAISPQERTQITDHMAKIRNETLEKRKTYYVQERISNQIAWYVEKSRWNGQKESQWSLLAWILEIAAAIISIIMITSQDIVISPVGIALVAGAGVLFWINARSYSESTQSYALVAQKLGLFENRVKHVSTEKELERIVLGVEGIIKSEQAIWLSRLA